MTHIRIIPLETFYGASNAAGTQGRQYKTGEEYSVPESLAETFIESGLVTLPEDEIAALQAAAEGQDEDEDEDENDEQEEPEEKPETRPSGQKTKRRKKQAATPAESSVPAIWQA